MLGGKFPGVYLLSRSTLLSRYHANQFGVFFWFFPPAVAVPQSPAEISLAAQGGKGSTSSLNSSTSSDKGDKDGRGKVGRWVLFPCIAAFFLCYC